MASQDDAEQKAARPKRHRKWPWILLGLILLVGVLVALAPVYLSSDSFKRMIQAKISQSTGGTADIGNLSVGWWKGVRVSDFSFRDENGWAAVSIDALNTQPRLASLLGGTFSLGRTVIDSPQIDIDLRKRPAPTPSQGRNAEKPGSSSAAALAVLSDMQIKDGTIHVTDTTGQTVRIAKLNSTLNIGLPGQTSSIQADMVVGQAGDAATVRASGTVTPAKSPDGWSLKDTSGDVVVEVNDLKLESLAPIFELAGIELEARGQVSANITAAVQNGKLENLKGTVTGRDVDVTGDLLKGDRLQTSRLNVDAQLARQGRTMRVEQLNARTDWANVTATGTIPLTPASLTELLKADSSYSLKGDFDCNLPALLSQMPAAFQLKEGTQIIAGKAEGHIDTSTQDGRATILAQTQITGLSGTVDGKPLSLSEPVAANLTVSADEKTVRVDTMEVSAAFGQVTASGDFNDIGYDGQIDLAKLQSELGQFASLGPYGMAGNVASKGQVAIQDQRIGATGSATLRQVVLTSTDGNSVSEPAADITFAFDMDQGQNALTVDRLDAQGSFGSVAIQNASVPLNKTSSVPMNLAVSARDLDLRKLTPYAVLFASLPEKMRLQGIAQSTLTVTGQDGAYRVQTEDTTIQDFVLATEGKKPFSQKQVSAKLDFEFDPNAKTVRLDTVQLVSPDITFNGKFHRTAKADRIQVSGELAGECDWAAVGHVAAPVLPEGLELSGRREISLDFQSTYPTDDPNGLMANLNGSAAGGFASAQYKGLNIGSTDVKVQVEEGLMKIEPFTTAVNNGELNFAGRANFREPSRLLKTPEPLMLARGIELNQEMTNNLLQYVNPLFANVTGISGIANFECRSLAIPLAPGLENKAEVAGTFSANDILLEASGLLDQILEATGQSLRGQRLTVRPTNITLKDGIVRYDDMQIDVGDNPINFAGAVGLDERLDMTVTLPWTLKGRTARVDNEGKTGQRIEVPLTGTIRNPKLDLQKFLQEQLFRGLGDLLR